MLLSGKTGTEETVKVYGLLRQSNGNARRTLLLNLAWVNSLEAQSLCVKGATQDAPVMQLLSTLDDHLFPIVDPPNHCHESTIAAQFNMAHVLQEKNRVRKRTTEHINEGTRCCLCGHSLDAQALPQAACFIDGPWQDEPGTFKRLAYDRHDLNALLFRSIRSNNPMPHPRE